MTRDRTLDAALDWLAPYGPELANGFTSHAPMVAEALCALGRPEAVMPWLERRAEQFRARAAPSAAIAPDAWREALGSHHRGSDWVALLRADLGAGPWSPFLRRWLVRLMPGFCADALHGPIRVAHAARALGAADTPQRRSELVEGLAAWAGAYQTLPVPADRKPGTASPEAAVRALPLQPEDERTFRGSIVSALYGLAGFDAFRPVIDAVEPGARLDGAVSSLSRAFARVYLANARDPLHAIVFVHGVTSAAALRSLLPHVSEREGRDLFAYAWQAAAGLYATFGQEPSAAAPSPAARVARETLVERAVANGDDHVIKLTEACLAEDARAPAPEYLAAALHATEILAPPS